jgi:hypothetical protein
MSTRTQRFKQLIHCGRPTTKLFSASHGCCCTAWAPPDCARRPRRLPQRAGCGRPAVPGAAGASPGRRRAPARRARVPPRAPPRPGLAHRLRGQGGQGAPDRSAGGGGAGMCATSSLVPGAAAHWSRHLLDEPSLQAEPCRPLARRRASGSASTAAATAPSAWRWPPPATCPAASTGSWRHTRCCCQGWSRVPSAQRAAALLRC